MPDFVLNRNHTLSGKGHMINFIKGQPTPVPACLMHEAAAIGAEPVDGEHVDPLGQEASAPRPEQTPAQRLESLFAAFDLLVERNETSDFGGDGKPTVEAVEKLGDFMPKLNKKELYVAWQKHREAKAG